MKTAIIDLGTNTFNLIIFEKDKSSYDVVYKNKIEVKLGEGGLEKNIIAKKAYERGFEAMKQHSIDIKKHQAEKTIAFATSAIRSTTNGNEFVEDVKKQIGIDIKIIDGNQEAELIYFGVKQALNLKNEINLIMDIGGGSTEFIIANNKEILWKKSYQLGVSRLREIFKPNDPILQKDIDKLNNYFNSNLKSLHAAIKDYKAETLIGSSGSFESLALMIGYHFLDSNVLKGVTNFQFDINQIRWAHDFLIKSNYKQRLSTAGISPMRADMIVIASIFIHYIIKMSGINKIKLSSFSLKEGVIYKEMLD